MFPPWLHDGSQHESLHLKLRYPKLWIHSPLTIWNPKLKFRVKTQKLNPFAYQKLQGLSRAGWLTVAPSTSNIYAKPYATRVVSKQMVEWKHFRDTQREW